MSKAQMTAVRLPIKALSTNQLYIGRKIKSAAARQFEESLAVLLAVHAKDKDLPDGELAIHYRIGVSRRSDLDNCLKLLQDGIARHYGIDDRRFCAHTAVRVPVKKGGEFLMFRIEAFDVQQFPSMIGVEMASS